MIITKPSIELFPKLTKENILTTIERAGRVCYKSEDKITDGSAVEFIKKVADRKHYAVIEHGNLIFRVDDGDTFNEIYGILEDLKLRGVNHYIRCTKSRHIFSGNIRAFLEVFGNVRGYIARWSYEDLRRVFSEADFIFDMFSLPKVSENGSCFEPAELIWDENSLTDFEKSIHVQRAIKFTCDRGVTHEIVRHRPASYCQESTRYCNYSKDKFGNQITVIKPCYLDEDENAYDDWEDAMRAAEGYYFSMLENGRTPQEARAVLPNSLKTEIVMSANLEEWQHFFELRTVPAAHPQMREVAVMAFEAMKGEYPEVFA